MLLNVIRNYPRLRVARYERRFASKKQTPRKPDTRVLPVFQYPTSKPTDRRVYVWGLGEHGGLGAPLPPLKGTSPVHFRKPKRLRFAEEHEVTDVECGYGFTVFAVRSEKQIVAYGSGINTDSQLGAGKTDEGRDVPVIIPRPLNLPLTGSETQVLGLSAGRAHLLILTSEGTFALGNNAYGQCGRPVIHDEDYSAGNVIHRIPDIAGDRVVSVTAGQDHSILLMESGQVYAFGWGADGQTGLAHYRNEYKPTLVKGDLAGERIVKLACVADCVLALSDKGKVFGWGNSEYGQLPTNGDNHQINVATEIIACRRLGRIVDIAAGGSFCMVLNAAGNVYVWGYGILGLGPEVQKSKDPTIIPPTLFGLNSYQPESRVLQISCGISQLAAITRSGDLYMWGRNKFGSLGLGHENDQFFPLKVAVGARVKKVSCGVDHTIALCEPYV